MLRFEFLTVHQLSEWQVAHPIDSKNPLTNMFAEDFADYKKDRVVAVLALNDGELVGRITLAYSCMSVNGSLIQCIVGQRLLVREDFRKKTVGISILLKVLSLKIPYFAGSVSSEMGKIFDAWTMFHKIDSSPVYSVGITLPAAIRLARLSLQRINEHADSVRFYKSFSLVFGQIWSMYRLQNQNKKKLCVLPEAEALDKVESVLGLTKSAVQIPWSRNILTQAIKGINRKCFAWLVEIENEGRQQYYFVCIYLKDSRLSLLRTSDVRRVKIAELTEVFPTVCDEQIADIVLSFAARQAARLKVDLLHVHAMTGVLEAVCKKHSMQSFFDRRIYMTPSGLDKEIADVVSDPNNWWCRAASEVQFDELSNFEQHGTCELQPYLL